MFIETSVERLFLAVPRGCLQFVIVVFPDHTHLLFLLSFTIYHFTLEVSINVHQKGSSSATTLFVLIKTFLQCSHQRRNYKCWSVLFCYNSGVFLSHGQARVEPTVVYGL